ncbi:MAG: transglutaminase domain-containing protein [Alphaproteobacteria bacterium]|nr:transglutaminase domain-containing protein [Alphaproteobacteria bacterium]
MKTPGPQNYYLEHGPLSDPGRHGTKIGRIPGSSIALCETVQGLLMHDAALSLYGVDPSNFARFSRETLAVEHRLDQFCASSGALDLSATPPDSRMVGTCRDYALLMAGLLRAHGLPARVRCGFAAYLTPGTFDDHWICQAWHTRDQRWQIIDAQLDERHRSALSIRFNHLDLPDDQFLNAGQAWQAVRAGMHDAGLFNAGAAACGEWVIFVNLARDYLALCKQETSDWDRWREAPEAARRLNERLIAWADDLAAESAAKAVDGERARDPGLPGPPFW